MSCSCLTAVVLVVTLLCASSAFGSKPTASEIARAKAWASDRFGAKRGPAPFSFTYGGRPSRDLLQAWKMTRKTRRIDSKRTETTLAYSDPDTGLTVGCKAVQYRDFPTVEWTIRFRNDGSKDTPILSDVKALDVAFERPGKGPYLLHTTNGDFCDVASYEPWQWSFPAGTSKHFEAYGGRPTNYQWPFWNFAMPDGGGVIAVLGWPGQWSADFANDASNTLRLTGGQQFMHFALHPGEEVRTPLAVLQFYDGDWLRGQNVWRRWVTAHNQPATPTHYAICAGDLQPNAAMELEAMEGVRKAGLTLEYFILDAGWYPDRGGWWNTGTWEVDRERFPGGIKQLSDTARKYGMGFVLWFEPERVAPGSELYEQHPEWLLGTAPGANESKLLDLGDPDAWKWVVKRIGGLITEFGLTGYRQDYNIDPLAHWRANDQPDRQGITEAKYVAGYLAYWDELLKTHPGLWIDSCASGGRRNDLETMRRSIPLLRSDCFESPTSQQCHTYGLSLWMPYHGSGAVGDGEYWFRSSIFPASRFGWDPKTSPDKVPFLKRMLAEFRAVQPYLLDDYYPLTPYSRDKNVWMAWQYDSPEKDGGFVQAFRREEAADGALRLKLRGLDRKATYSVRNLDLADAKKVLGADLIDKGIELAIDHQPGAAILVYKRVR